MGNTPHLNKFNVHLLGGVALVILQAPFTFNP